MLITVSPMGQLAPELVEAIHTHAAFALTRFGRDIRSVNVRVADTNGPRGGVDQECTVTLRLIRPGEDVVVSHTGADPFAAMSRALTRAARTVARRLDRRRSRRVPGSADRPARDFRQSP